MAYDKLKDLAKTTQSDKVLREKAFKIVSDPKYDGYQKRLASMIYKFFDKKSSGNGIGNEPNYPLADGLHNRLFKNLKREKFSHRLETIFGLFI